MSSTSLLQLSTAAASSASILATRGSRTQSACSGFRSDSNGVKRSRSAEPTKAEERSDKAKKYLRVRFADSEGKELGGGKGQKQSGLNYARFFLSFCPVVFYYKFLLCSSLSHCFSLFLFLFTSYFLFCVCIPFFSPSY